MLLLLLVVLVVLEGRGGERGSGGARPVIAERGSEKDWGESCWQKCAFEREWGWRSWEAGWRVQRSVEGGKVGGQEREKESWPPTRGRRRKRQERA